MWSARLMRCFSVPIVIDCVPIGATYYVMDEYFKDHKVGSFIKIKEEDGCGFRFGVCPVFKERFGFSPPVEAVSKLNTDMDLEAWINALLHLPHLDASTYDVEVVHLRFMRCFSLPGGDAVDGSGDMYYLVDENFRVYMIGSSVKRSTKNLSYAIYPGFLEHKLIESLPIGSVFKWSKKTSFDIWIHKQIYFSHANVSKQNANHVWFVKHLTRDDRNITPTGFLQKHPSFNGWVLIQSGWKAFSVQIINGEVKGGWNNFWIQHRLRDGCTLLLGSEHERIFDVAVLDAHHNRVMYTWTKDIEAVNVVPPQAESSDNMSPSILPSKLMTSFYEIQFGHFYSSPEILHKELCRQFAIYLQDDGVSSLQFYMGEHLCVVEKYNQNFTPNYMCSFARLLKLNVGDFLFMAAISAAEIRVLIFDSTGVERYYI